jgi:hypothetical protein
MRAILNATNTAHYLSLTESEVLELAQLGQIPYRILVGQYLFLITELDAWFAALPGVNVYEAIAPRRPQTPRSSCAVLRLEASSLVPRRREMASRQIPQRRGMPSGARTPASSLKVLWPD